MNQNLLTVIIYTIIGMSLVFIAMSMIWLMILLITGIFKEGGKINIDEQEKKMKAAAIAVAIALSENKPPLLHIFPLPETPLVSAWQAVLRSNILNKRGVRR